MKTSLFLFTLTLVVLSLPLAAAVWAASAPTAPLQIVSARGALAAFEAVRPTYEQTYGETLAAYLAPSRGSALSTLFGSLSNGQSADVALLDRMAIFKLASAGELKAEQCTDFARSYIAMAVPTGTAKPDITSMESFKQTLLQAKSMVYPNTASGLYLENVLFNLMGIKERIQAATRLVRDRPISDVLAHREADIGFAQLSELKDVEGVDVVGLIPDQAQQMTLYTACLLPGSKRPEQAQRFIDYLNSSTAIEAMGTTGLKPVNKSAYEARFGDDNDG
ncbi:substrate-binding domain-containing protein [Pseudomonas duriflava]|nr:substrate-binding domain-containing protein [Pseudomonas duriflava]